MFSTFIKASLALIGFSPVLISLYIVKLFQLGGKLRFYLSIQSVSDFASGLVELLRVHYLLLIFVIIIVLTRLIINKAKKSLPIGRIDVKSIKPADTNFITPLFSIILPFFKIPASGITDLQSILGFIIICLAYALIMRRSYHFNLVLKLFLGYNHYEVQTKAEVAYIVLSKAELINPKQLTEYVYLSNYMLLNVSNNNPN